MSAQEYKSVDSAPDGSIDPRQFRAVLGRFASGVTVITTEHEGKTHGMTANAFMSISLNPPLVLVSLDNQTKLHQLLPLTQHYGVSILADAQETHSSHFAGRKIDGLEINFIRIHAMPLVAGAVAHLVCRVVETHPVGDHTLYIGQVEFLQWQEAKPLLFYAGKYRFLDVERQRSAHWPEDEFSLFSIGPFDQ